MDRWLVSNEFEKKDWVMSRHFLGDWRKHWGTSVRIRNLWVRIGPLDFWIREQDRDAV
jgi:hypothetical protein